VAVGGRQASRAVTQTADCNWGLQTGDCRLILLDVGGIDRLRGVWWSALPASPAPRADRASSLTRSLVNVNAEPRCATSPGKSLERAPGSELPDSAGLGPGLGVGVGPRAWRGGWAPGLARGDGMGRRLYVGNLPYTTGEAELQELFSKAGTVETVRVMRDAATGRARGFAFVEMATDEEAQKAATEFNQYQMGGRALTVNEARPKPEGGFGGGGGGGGYGGNRGGGGGGGGRREPRW